MTIKIVQNLVSPNKYGIKSPYTMNAQYITFHNTANNASARSEVNYMIGNDAKVSYHFAVDDKEVVQGVPTNRIAWHCGDGMGNGNMKSIGVEVCYSKSGGAKYDKAEELGIQFIAQLLHERNWGVDRVKPHKFWSGKNCPHRILDSGRWDSVLNRIDKALQALKSGKSATPIKNIEPDKGYLSLGDTGAKVETLQTNLNKVLNLKLVVDGSFGKATEDAVKAFQRKYKLEVDGFFGSGSEKKMTQVLADLNKPKPTPVPKPVEKPKEEELEMTEKAIVINSFIDYPAVQKLHIRTGYPIFERAAIKEKVAKELIIAGGGKKGLEKFADKFTDLSGKTRAITGNNVDEYMNKLNK